MLPDELLLQVEKPARYTGNEINMVIKDPEKIDIRFAFCFPDVYEVGTVLCSANKGIPAKSNIFNTLV